MTFDKLIVGIAAPQRLLVSIRGDVMQEGVDKMVLKFAVFPLAVVVALLAADPTSAMDEEMAELAKMVRDNCAAETGVDLALVEKVNAGADLMEDAILKCYIKCTMETAGMMSDGIVDVEAVLALMPDDMRNRNQDLMRGCGTVVGADHCDNAFKTQQCWQKANKKDYFLI